MKKNQRTASPNVGDRIIAGLQEIVDAMESGTLLHKHLTVRDVVVPEAGIYKARSIKLLRTKLGINQKFFAYLIGVSPVLVQAWEQGRRTPSPMARRLLDEISRDPKRWIGMLEPARAA